MAEYTLAPVSAPIDRAAELVGLSRDTIERAVRAGELPMHYPTARGVILVDDLRAWIEASPTVKPGLRRP